MTHARGVVSLVPAGAPLFVLLTLSMLAVEALVVRSSGFAADPALLAAAVTVDLVVGMPALGWLLLVRKRKVSAVVLVPLFLMGVLAAKTLLPAAHEGWVDLAAMALPVAEGIALVALVIGVRRVRAAYRRERARTPYPLDALRASVTEFRHPLAAELLVTEVWLLHAAVTGWFRRADVPADVQPFPLHRRSGYAAILAVIAGVLVVETFAVHLLLAQWSGAAAWIATALSGYSLLWIVGDYHAMRLHPPLVDAGLLRLRLGLRWRVDVATADVVSARRRRVMEDRSGLLALAPIGEPDVILELRRPVVARGLFGRTRRVERIGVAADDRNAFLEALRRQGVHVD